MTRPNYKTLRRESEKTHTRLASENLHQAEVRLKGEESNGIIAQRELVNLLLENATNYLARVVKTEDGTVGKLELRIAEAHRLRAALDCRMQRGSFRLVKGGEGVLS